jgi:hypothetical protein
MLPGLLPAARQTGHLPGHRQLNGWVGKRVVVRLLVDKNLVSEASADVIIGIKQSGREVVVTGWIQVLEQVTIAVATEAALTPLG